MTSPAPVALVTGASRGAGRGIAVALGRAGYTVYLSGRSEQEGDAALPGTIHATARDIVQAGGRAVAVRCDHARDGEVEALFARIRDEQGALEVLVNNATALPDELLGPGGFWEKPLSMLRILDVGMRSHYVASWHAVPLMLAHGHGLIVNTSSFGGVCYMHGPAYGAGKAAVDKMAHDMAVELRGHDIAVVSLWMGLLRTERTTVALRDPKLAGEYAPLLDTMESPEMSGELIARLARDPRRMERSGRVLIGAELAAEYGIRLPDGREPVSYRAMLGEPPAFSAAIVR